MSDTTFQSVPGIPNMPTSTFNQNHKLFTTFNTGKVIPIYCNEVLPGDIFDMNTSMVLRSSTPITASMDNAFLDTAYFYVPSRLLWDHWEEFMGANKTDEWDQKTDFTVPHITIPSGGFLKGTIADYFGIPQGIGDHVQLNHLPFRAYVKIWNDWYRDENTQKQALNVTGDAPTTGIGVPAGDPIQNAIKGCLPLPANKYKDYFTSMLPSPQKGKQVGLALLGSAPVKSDPIHENGGIDIGFDTSNVPLGSHNWTLGIQGLQGLKPMLGFSPNASNIQGQFTADDLLTNSKNLYADLSQASGGSVNDLRENIALQQILELDARAGTRYNEKLQAFFGVAPDDYTLGRAEYLAGQHIAIEQGQVAQTSSTDAASPQGNIAAFSLTSGSGQTVQKGFKEHGYVIGVAMVRTHQTYSQGIEKMWSRKSYTDFYNPLLANLGEQPVLNKEIFVTDNLVANDEVLGYQEAWAEYKFKLSQATGDMSVLSTKSLAYYHYGNKFEKKPVLDGEFMKETPLNVDRSLAVQMKAADQWIANFYFVNNLTRRMPIHSVPGGLERLY